MISFSCAFSLPIPWAHLFTHAFNIHNQQSKTLHCCVSFHCFPARLLCSLISMSRFFSCSRKVLQFCFLYAILPTATWPETIFLRCLNRFHDFVFLCALKLAFYRAYSPFTRTLFTSPSFIVLSFLMNNVFWLLMDSWEIVHLAQLWFTLTLEDDHAS